MENRYIIKLDMQNGTVTPATYKQGNARTSIIEVLLTNGGKPVDITSQNIVFNFELSDRTVSKQDMSIVDDGISVINAMTGDFQCELKMDALSVVGFVKCDIDFTLGTDLLTTKTFQFVVSSSVGLISINYISEIESQIAEWQTEVNVYKNAYDSASKANLSLEVSNTHIGSDGKTYTNLPARLDSVDSSLADKANQVDVNTQIASMSSGTPLFATSTPEMTDITRAYCNITDGYIYLYSSTNLVFEKSEKQYQSTGISKKSIVGDMLVSKTVSIDKVNFIKRGKNQLNLMAVSALGNWVNYVSGAYQSYPSNADISQYYFSEKIPTIPGEIDSRKYGIDSTVFFDMNDVFISGTQENTFTAPSNTAYKIVNFTNYHMDEQVEEGSVSTSYEPFGIKLLNPSAIPYTQLDDMGIEKNQFNVKTLSPVGQWINPNTGELQTYPSYEYIPLFHYSSHMPLEPGKPYHRWYGNDGISFWDKDDKFISGSLENVFTTPTNLSYAIANIQNIDFFDQIEPGIIGTAYEPYGVKIKYPGASGEQEIFRLNLPSKIYGIVGKETNIYFDNLMIDDAVKYNWNVDCSIGIQQNERYTVIPTLAGTYPLTISIYKNCGDIKDVLTMVSATLIIADINTGNGLNKKLLDIGDSTTKGMIDSGVLTDNFNSDVMDITLLGTMGIAPNLSEGHPGKDTNFVYTDATSPFLFNGAFDFAQYMSAHGYANVDYVALNFGINDMYVCLSDEVVNNAIARAMAQYEGMITSIHVFDPNIKIGIFITIPPSYNQDACNDTQQARWRHKRNIMLWDKQLLAQFNGREDSNIFVVAYGSSLDTLNNMWQSTVLANSRATVSIIRQGNMLHPQLSGYGQMADSSYYWIKNMV